MIVVNKQANSNVTQTTVRNFYPKNPPKSMSLNTMAQSQDNFHRNNSYNQIQNSSNHNYQLSHSVTPHSASGKKFDEYVSAYGSPKYQMNNSQSQQMFNNTASSFFQPQKSSSLSQSQKFIPQSQNQAHTQINGKTFTEEQNKDKLNDARKNRQQTELNVNMLKNRIHLLELKEKQTMQKMIETQKRTIDIIMNKTNHQQKLQNKHENHLSQQEELIRRQMEVKQLRDEKKIKDNLQKQQRIKSAQVQAKRIKDLKDLYATHQQYMQEEMWLRNAQSYETVKLQEKEQEIKRKQLEASKKNLAHELYKNKCKSEISKKTQNELFCMELERREQELLKKLQQSQNLQSVAINELQKVMHKQNNNPFSNNSSSVLKPDTHNYYLA